MNAVPKCTSWRGHKFEGRYDKGQAHMSANVRGCTVEEFAELLEQHRSVTYVRDVCVRCGFVIERGLAQ